MHTLIHLYGAPPENPKSQKINPTMTTQTTEKKKRKTGSEHQPTQSSNIIIAAGTYEGTVAGYEVDGDDKHQLQLLFDSPAHQGSVRSVASCTKGSSCILVSTGYDELLQLHDFGTRTTGTGHVRTPADYGTPTVVAFAPPSHCLVGFSESGTIVIYKRRDWSVQHVLKGHEGGVAAMAVHPSGKVMVSGGLRDGKLKIWDLERGRLAFSGTAVPTARTHVEGKKRYDAVECIVWRCSAGDDAGKDDCYAFCYGSHITVRDVATGKDLLDVELPSKVNQVCFMDGQRGLFVAAACDDGSLPVLAVHAASEEERPAIMAIEPAAAISGVERYKCIHAVSDYIVATATSTGVVSVMNLQGAVNMILTSMENDEDDDNSEANSPPAADDAEEELELAVDILDSKLLGRGARITCLSVWTTPKPSKKTMTTDVPPPTDEVVIGNEKNTNDPTSKGRSHDSRQETVLEDADVRKARALVSKAKKIQKKKTKRKHGLAKKKIKT